MSIWELMTGVSLEAFGAVFSASFFVAQCVMQEIAQPPAEAESP